jgi:rubrerythrin
MNDDEIYECDGCGSEVKESDTSCPKCRAEFEE